MTPSTNLFDIIHSLTASEKRYFKIFSSTHVIGAKNNYEKLFNAYCELPANQPYNEAAFKKKLTGKTWTKNFAVEKKFLEEMVMKAMRAYNAEKSGQGQLNDLIANVHFLYNKGLINAASKELKKGIDLGEVMENLPGLLILYQLKLNLAPVTQTAADLKEAEEDLKIEADILLKLDNERRVVHARRKIFNLYLNGQLKSNLGQAKKMITGLELHEAKHTLTYKARLSLFFVRALVAEKEGRYSDAMHQYEQANAIWKRSELKLRESYSNLRMILSNYLVCAHYAERFDVYPAIIDQIENFPVENISERADTFVITKGSRLLYLLNSKNKSGSEILIKQIRDGLKEFQSYLPRQQMIYINTNVCLLRFQTQKYPELMDSLNETFANIGRDEKMVQPLFILKFLEIMTHISLRNEQLLDYQLRNTNRWLHEHNLDEPFTNFLLKSFPAIHSEPEYSLIKQRLTSLDCTGNAQLLKALVLEWMDVNLPSNAKRMGRKTISNPVELQNQ